MSPWENSVTVVASLIASKLCHYKLFANSVTCSRGFRTLLSSFDSHYHWIVNRIVFAEKEVLKEKDM